MPLSVGWTPQGDMPPLNPVSKDVWMYSHHYLAVDLGQVQDYTAVALMEHRSRFDHGIKALVHEYEIQHLERFALGTEYPAIIERLVVMWDQPFMKNHGTLLIDQTGVGRAVVDMAKDRGLPPIGVTITGGNSASYDEIKREYKVPKSELIHALLLLAQSGQLKILKNRPEAQMLKDELGTFKIKRSTRSNANTYEAAQEKEHDDLVIAVALAAWLALRERKRGNTKILSMLKNRQKILRGYDPLDWGNEREAYDPLNDWR